MSDIFWINSEGDTRLDDACENNPNKFPARERRIFTKWDACAKYTNSIFRVQARIREDWIGREHEEITVTTEFIALAGRPKFWKKVFDFANETNGKIEWEWISRHLDHSWKTDDEDNKIPGTERFGKNHGKWERQVGLVWTFPVSVKPVEIERFIKQMRFEIDKTPLRKQWVSVC